MTTTKRRTTKPAPLAVPSMPLELAGLFRWDSHPNATGEVRLQSAEFTTKWYYIADRAIVEALRWVGSQPKAKPAEQLPTVQYIPLDQIRTDGGTQARAQLDPATVDDYAETWLTLSHRQNGFDQMPPIVVYYDGTDYWLADGFHRVAAYQQFVDGRFASASPRGLQAEVRQGTRRDAVLYACGANAAHGLRRTNADKRRAVETLLRDEEWRQWSDSEIARRCQVDHKTVAAVRAELYPGNSQDSRTVTRGGTTYEMTPAARPTTSDPFYAPAAQHARLRAAAIDLELSYQEGRGWMLGAVGPMSWPQMQTRLANLEAKALAQPTDDQVAQMRERFYALGYEQFYSSDAGWTAYHPRTKKANYKTWAAVEADITRKEAMAAPRLCDRCGKDWGKPGSMIVGAEKLCQDCAAARLSSGQPFAQAPLPPAPPGWIIYRDGDIIGLEHETKMRLSGQDAAALIDEATAGEQWLAVLSAGDWSVFYDAACPAHLHAYTATHQLHETQAAHDLPHLALLAWHANLFDDDLPDWPIELIDALFLAGHDPLDLGKRGLPLGELYHLAGLEQRATITAPIEPKPAQRHPCATCGKPSTTRLTIGGVYEPRCDGCTMQAERDDLAVLLGDQYLGIATDRGDPLDNRTHRIAWTQGGGGDYTYVEALERLAQRPQRAIPPTDPIESARAFLDTQTAAMRAWDNSALPTRREYETALMHIKALLQIVATAS